MKKILLALATAATFVAMPALAQTAPAADPQTMVDVMTQTFVQDLQK